MLWIFLSHLIMITKDKIQALFYKLIFSYSIIFIICILKFSYYDSIITIEKKIIFKSTNLYIKKLTFIFYFLLVKEKFQQLFVFPCDQFLD